MINALFICSQNKLRSPTAELVFAKWPNVETDSAGLNNDAEVLLTPEQIDWADIIFVMDQVDPGSRHIDNLPLLGCATARGATLSPKKSSKIDQSKTKDEPFIGFRPALAIQHFPT